MSTLAEDDPIRAIRNALERLSRVSSGTPLEEHVAEEASIVEEALAELARPLAALRLEHPFPLSSTLRVLAEATTHLRGDHNCDCVGHERRKYAEESARAILEILEAPRVAPAEALRRCRECGFSYGGEAGVCPRCDLFADVGTDSFTVYPSRREDEES